MIGVLDYGLGNVSAFMNIYQRFGIRSKLVHTPEELRDVTKLILPGVGAFDFAMTSFNNSGLRPAVESLVLGQGTPLLGVCVGMQMLANASEEGSLPGLGWVAGSVRRLSSSTDSRLKLPHMGWNKIEVTANNPLIDTAGNGSRFYFLHSYYFSAEESADILAKTYYGQGFACAVRRGVIYGVQFHPEKSHRNGEQLLLNFAKC